MRRRHTILFASALSLASCGALHPVGPTTIELEERNPAVSDLHELSSGVRFSISRADPHRSLSYEVPGHHSQSYAPVEGVELDDVSAEIQSLLLKHGWSEASPYGGSWCAEKVGPNGLVDRAIVSVVAEPIDPDSGPHVSLRLRLRDSC